MSVTPQFNIQNLESIISNFTQVSVALDESYSHLQKQVEILNRELGTARSSRIQDLRIKEQLASKLSILMESLPGGIIVTDENGYVLQENPALNQILDTSLLNYSWPVYLKKCIPLHKDNLQAFTLPNGRSVSILSRKFGTNNHKIILITDISENICLQRKLNQDTKLIEMGEMTGRLAHQIRTPLSSALLYLSQLKNIRNNPQEIPACVTKIKNRLQQVENLIESMLAYIRDGAKSRQLYSLELLLTATVNDYSARLSELDGEIKLHNFTIDSVILCNPMEISNALSNLIENAISVADVPPCIILELSRDDNNLYIRVIDNGPGIELAIIDRIFEPFFSTRTNGTGLGLAIVISIIKGHGGTILAENNKNKGAFFEIALPTKAHTNDISDCLWHGMNECYSEQQVKENSE